MDTVIRAEGEGWLATKVSAVTKGVVPKTYIPTPSTVFSAKLYVLYIADRSIRISHA